MSLRNGRTALALVLATLVLAPWASLAAASPPLPLIARMNGGKEVPGPGDPDGRGRAGVAAYPMKHRLCFALKVRDITLPADAAHVHAGDAATAGPVVVTLVPPDDEGVSAGCVEVPDERLLRDIKRNPREYYVNVHTSDFSAGAVRGQLRPFPA